MISLLDVSLALTFLVSNVPVTEVMVSIKVNNRIKFFNV